jgi:predicted amidohydrolase YtcJ
VLRAETQVGNLGSMSADLIITNARILTMNGASPRAEALAIAGNRILRIGSKDDVADLKAKHTRIVNAEMKTVMPGIIESHLHIFGGSVELDSLNINQISGLRALTDSIREYAAKRAKAGIVIASGALPTSFGPPITRLLLDSVIGDRPFAVICFDHHTIWANTMALTNAGLLYGKLLPPGNEIVIGDDGTATGELREPAAYEPIVMMTETKGRDWLGLLTGGDPDPPATAEERAIDQRVMKRGLDYCASLGITSLQNMDGNYYQLELLKAVMDRGELCARVEIPFHHKNFFETRRVAEALEMKRQYQGDMLHGGGRVKIFMDGVLESLTALMIEPYPGFPDNLGAPNFTAEQFNEVAILADSLGLQISVHAIGDGGVRRTLDGYEAARGANGPRDSRHRIEHIELIDEADVPRLKELGVIASLQPIVGLGVAGNPQEPTRSRIVPEKLPYAYAWQTLRETGARVAFSSDWPVSPLNPFIGMQAAMTSKPLGQNCPPQAQSLMDTLESYTTAGAYCEFREDRKGMLQEGYLADVVVLDFDVERTAPEDMETVKPVLTICDGRVTFEA